MNLDPRLLKILACPVCRGELKLKEEKLVCGKCGKSYPIRNGIPILLP
jgi:uncharacterized protein YbaR (Trm112 family)